MNDALVDVHGGYIAISGSHDQGPFVVAALGRWNERSDQSPPLASVLTNIMDLSGRAILQALIEVAPGFRTG